MINEEIKEKEKKEEIKKEEEKKHFILEVQDSITISNTKLGGK